jgi:hypothetical protein
MGEGYAHFRPSFNRSIRIPSYSEMLSSDGGGILLREAMVRLGGLKALTQELHDPRNPDYVRHSLHKLILGQVLLLAQGWRAGAPTRRATAEQRWRR